ncbi:MAG: flagellar motor protein MotB [Alphaproteobacteria bacterium]|nr:flagellar motor protein MotB [Alphaproteobacteria bacterium]
MGRAAGQPIVLVKPAPNASGMLKGGWLLTLTDCILLLLAFFVMLVSMSSVKNERWREFSASLAGALRPITAYDPRPFPRPFALSDASAGIRDVDYMAVLLANTVARERALAGFALARTAEGLAIRPPADVWQGDGVGPAGQAAAAMLAERLRLVENELIVRVGVAPDSAGWARAMLRGVALADGLRRGGYPRAIAVLGSAAERPPGGAEVELMLRPALGAPR